MPKTYVNNASNRSLGRVGMEHGSMVVSRSSSGGGSYSGGVGVSSGGSSSAYAVSSPKTYVDNASNRSLGRVGMEHGSMVVSRSSSSSTSGSGVVGVSSGGSYSAYGVSSPKTYVDNASNRRLGRVGMEHGSMVVSRSSSSGTSGSGVVGVSSGGFSSAYGVSSPKTYVDNASNWRLGRVGMEHGSMVVSQRAKVYKDNSFNRKLDRVGKPLGTAVHSRRAKSESGSSTIIERYADNSFNRSLGRVGQPRGSMPSSRKSKQVDTAKKIIKDIENDTYDEDYERGYHVDPYALEIAMSQINRKFEEMTWAQEQNENQPPKTKDEILEIYSGVVIQFEDIELGRKIGQGGFGDVYFAQWKGSVVAVKKLRLQRVSKRRLGEFIDEIAIFCDLDHPNIVKFIGACTKTPNLCIVMEYMPMSLFDALHFNEDTDFSEGERLQIITQTCSGLEYLHKRGIAHCDLKSQNVLLDYLPGEKCFVKITDFGLSMIKANTETSVSGSEELVRNVGTPRYSAPEVLRGEGLLASDMMCADAYSLSLIIYEVIYEEEPFYNFSYAQLRKQVGEKGTVPEFPVDIKIDGAVQMMIHLCWSFNPEKRPIVEDIDSFFKKQKKLYNK